MLVAWAIGGSLMGALSDRLGIRRLPYLISVVLTTMLWAVFLFVQLPYVLLYQQWIICKAEHGVKIGWPHEDTATTSNAVLYTG